MTLAEYHRLAMRTGSDAYLGPGELTMANCALGIAGEAGEFADLIKKYLAQGHTLDYTKAKLELGDVLWHVAAAAQRLGFNLAEVAEANIEKLKKRYPFEFEVERSVNRGEE